MKQLVSALCLSFACALHAQELVPEVELVVEELPIPAEIAAEIELSLGATPLSYRVFAQVEGNWELQSMIGTLEVPLFVNASGGFYQSTNGGPTSFQILPSVIAVDPAVAYDSWVTIGAENEVNNLLQPLPDFDIFDDWENGQNLHLSGFFGEGIFLPTIGFNPQNSPDANGQILLGQFTFNGELEGCMTLQFRKLNPDGSIFTIDGPNDAVTYSDLYCFSTEDSSPCTGDLTGSGTVNAGDILVFLADFGCEGPSCIGDLNGDEFTNAADLLVLLSQFGETCN
jgi:hypothetical protein